MQQLCVSAKKLDTQITVVSSFHFRATGCLDCVNTILLDSCLVKFVENDYLLICRRFQSLEANAFIASGETKYSASRVLLAAAKVRTHATNSLICTTADNDWLKSLLSVPGLNHYCQISYKK